ncbi:Uncharacterized protein TCM_040267 [Theobroma cacao]|uniref:Uncharacterized protein n=1 Tax=Theobroma cacao TaxID=3641 RepID=A0A061GT84_THECC|nr:Uncharacterized protein TCM_040267 [Theobroma cacao]
MMSTLEGRVAKMEVVVGETSNKLEGFEANMDELRSKDDELCGEFHKMIETLNHRNATLKELVKSLWQEVWGLRDKLVTLEATIKGGAQATQWGTRLKGATNNSKMLYSPKDEDQWQRDYHKRMPRSPRHRHRNVKTCQALMRPKAQGKGGLVRNKCPRRQRIPKNYVEAKNAQNEVV